MKHSDGQQGQRFSQPLISRRRFMKNSAALAGSGLAAASLLSGSGSTRAQDQNAPNRPAVEATTVFTHTTVVSNDDARQTYKTLR